MTEAVSKILAEEARRQMIPIEKIVGYSRIPHIVAARQFAMWRAYRETKASLSQVGRVFKRDHTTVLHAVQKIDAQMTQERAK